MSFEAVRNSMDFQNFLSVNRLEIPANFKLGIKNTGRIKDLDNNTLSVLLTYHDELTARDGKPFVRVFWFNGKGEQYFTIGRKAKELTPEQKRKYAIEKQKREAWLKEQELKSKQRAYHEYMQAAVPCQYHQYLTTKAVQVHYGVRVATQTITDKNAAGETVYRLCKGELVIPLIDVNKKFMTYQRIRADGKKLLCRDGVKSGGFFPIGRWNSQTTQVVLCEGYATGATLHESTGVTVFVCFDIGNIRTVAELLKAKYPHLDIVIASDFDLDKGQAGLITALELNKIHGFKVVFPITVLDGSDWNDLQHEADQDHVHHLFFQQLADIDARSPQDAANDFYDFLNEKNKEKLALAA